MVANNFLFEGKTQTKLIDQLYSLLEIVVSTAKEGKEVLNAIDPNLFQNHPEFKTYVSEENARIAEFRIHSLGNLIEFMKHPHIELDGKDKVKDECLKLWGIPVKHSADAKLVKARTEKAEDVKSEDEKNEVTVCRKSVQP